MERPQGRASTSPSPPSGLRSRGFCHGSPDDKKVIMVPHLEACQKPALWGARESPSQGNVSLKVQISQSCPTFCDPMDYRVHGIFQARILEWVAFPFSRGSSQLRVQTQVSHIAGRLFISWATREVPHWRYSITKLLQGIPRGKPLATGCCWPWHCQSWALGSPGRLIKWGLERSCESVGARTSEKNLLSSAVSLWRPLLTKLGILPVGKGNFFLISSPFSQSRQLRVNLELRCIKWITGTKWFKVVRNQRFCCTQITEIPLFNI